MRVRSCIGVSDVNVRMPGVTVSIDGHVVYTFGAGQNDVIGLVTTIPLEPPRSGHNVTVARPGEHLLNFCEVEVWGM